MGKKQGLQEFFQESAKNFREFAQEKELRLRKLAQEKELRQGAALGGGTAAVIIGGATGAAVGTAAFPGVGTAVGIALGAAAGGLLGGGIVGGVMGHRLHQRRNANTIREHDAGDDGAIHVETNELPPPPSQVLPRLLWLWQLKCQV
jgi:hypothetical protein